MIDDEDLQNDIEAMIEEIKAGEEKLWNSLSKVEQLQMFCAVVRRIYQGEIVDGRSYRGVLYDTFGFGQEAYLRAQFAGFMDLHNAIYTHEELKEEIERAKSNND